MQRYRARDLRLNAIEHVSLEAKVISSRVKTLHLINFVIQEGGVGLKGPRHILLKVKDVEFNEDSAVIHPNENEKAVYFPKTDGVIIFSSLLFFFN